MHIHNLNEANHLRDRLIEIDRQRAALESERSWVIHRLHLLDVRTGAIEPSEHAKPQETRR